MITKAKARFVRVSPQKMRLVANTIRGKNAREAERHLKFMPKRSANLLGKLLHSAISNAEERGDIDIDNLFVKSICVNEGPTMKRWMARARGSATPIFKRMSHIELELEER